MDVASFSQEHGHFKAIILYLIHARYIVPTEYIYLRFAEEPDTGSADSRLSLTEAPGGFVHLFLELRSVLSDFPIGAECRSRRTVSFTV